MTSTAAAPPDPELLAAVTELGSALRELGDAAVRTTVDVAELRAAAAGARALGERLRAAQRPVERLSALDDLRAFRRVYNPASGVGSPLAPPLVIRPVEGGILAEVTMGAAYEGPPGYVHGGVSAMLLDQLLGAASISAGLWGMTAQLRIDYHRPVPLLTPLVLTARVTGDAGRRSTVTGSIAPAGEPGRPLVEAHGMFVMPRRETREAYFGAITDASGAPTTPSRPTDASAPGAG